jgi:hypothetical protein
MIIHPVGAGSFMRTDMTKLTVIVAFRKSANAPKKTFLCHTTHISPPLQMLKLEQFTRLQATGAQKSLILAGRPRLHHSMNSKCSPVFNRQWLKSADKMLINSICHMECWIIFCCPLFSVGHSLRTALHARRNTTRFSAYSLRVVRQTFQLVRGLGVEDQPNGCH